MYYDDDMMMMMMIIAASRGSACDSAGFLSDIAAPHRLKLKCFLFTCVYTPLYHAYYIADLDPPSSGCSRGISS